MCLFLVVVDGGEGMADAEPTTTENEHAVAHFWW